MTIEAALCLGFAVGFFTGLLVATLCVRRRA